MRLLSSPGSEEFPLPKKTVFLTCDEQFLDLIFAVRFSHLGLSGFKEFGALTQMDPLTATLTFVGLSASLVTLLAAVGDASKTLFELRRKIKNAPRSAERLQQDLQRIQVLLDVIKDQSLKYEGLDVPQQLQHLWSSFVRQLESDVRDFKAKTSTFRLSMQGLKARIGHVFTEGIVNEFQNRYSGHIQTLIMVQNIVDG